MRKMRTMVLAIIAIGVLAVLMAAVMAVGLQSGLNVANKNISRE